MVCLRRRLRPRLRQSRQLLARCLRLLVRQVLLRLLSLRPRKPRRRWMPKGSAGGDSSREVPNWLFVFLVCACGAAIGAPLTCPKRQERCTMPKALALFSRKLQRLQPIVTEVKNQGISAIAIPQLKFKHQTSSTSFNAHCTSVMVSQTHNQLCGMRCYQAS